MKTNEEIVDLANINPKAISRYKIVQKIDAEIVNVNKEVKK